MTKYCAPIVKVYGCCKCGGEGDCNPGLIDGSLAYPGEIRLFPFREKNLPEGWYVCNGQRLKGEAMDVLKQLGDDFFADWNITFSEEGANVPDLLNEGDGYFLRPIDGVSRMPGRIQEDAIRNIIGDQINYMDAGIHQPGGHAFVTTAAGEAARGSGGTCTSVYMTFDASKAVPTAHENRPKNIGMTPAIYLGV